MGRPNRPGIVWTHGSWKARFTVNGRRMWESTGITDRAKRNDAVAAAWRIADEVRSGKHRPHIVRETTGKPSVELREAVSFWIAAIKGSYGDGTIALYKVYTRTWQRFFKSLDRMTDLGCKDYVMRRLTQVQKESVKKECTGLRLFTGWAAEHGILPVAPVVHGPSKKSKGTIAKKRVTVRLTAGEIEQLLNALPEYTIVHRLGGKKLVVRDRFIFAWETGMRPEMIDKLAAPMHYTKGAAFLQIEKWIDKNQDERGLPLSPRAREALDRVCPNKGRIFDAHDYRVILRQVAEALGWPAHKYEHLTEHCFRHNRATYWCEVAGDNLAGVQYLLGHRKISTTARYAEATRRAAVAVIAVSSASSAASSSVSSASTEND